MLVYQRVLLRGDNVRLELNTKCATIHSVLLSTSHPCYSDYANEVTIHDPSKGMVYVLQVPLSVSLLDTPIANM